MGITRCGCFFGPYDFNFTRLIPRVIRSVVEGKPPVLRPDDYVVRGYLHAEDAAEAHLLLAERLSEDETLHGEVFNFSYGDTVDVIDVVNRIIAICGAKLAPAVTDGAPAEIRRLEMSMEKAKRVLDWSTHESFQERLEQTVNWYRSYLAEATRIPVLSGS